MTSLESELSLQLYVDYYDRKELKFDEQRTSYDLDLKHQFIAFDAHELLWGGGYRFSDNDITSSKLISTATSSEQSKIWNLFIQDEIFFPEQDFSVTLGAKVEKSNASSTAVQPNLRASWAPANNSPGGGQFHAQNARHLVQILV